MTARPCDWCGVCDWCGAFILLDTEGTWHDRHDDYGCAGPDGHLIPHKPKATP